MSERALLVDDVANVLASFKRNLRGQFAFDVADSGMAALKMLSETEYAVLVTDMQMPEMDGLALLKVVKKRFPNVVRIMLTGNGDLQTAVDAVNEGDVFRFVSKPCSVDVLRSVITAGFRQHQLLMSEKVLLNDTVSGVVNVLSEVIGLVNPGTVTRNVQVKNYMMQLVRQMGLKPSWTFEPMIELSRLGAILTPSIEADRDTTSAMSQAEAELMEQHAGLAHDLLAQIPRFESISRSILYQDKCFDGQGFPNDDVKGEDIPFGARMLKVVNDFLDLRDAEMSFSDAIKHMHGEQTKYDKRILEAFNALLFQQHDVLQVSLEEIDVGMVVAEPLMTASGRRLAPSGQVITASFRQLLSRCVANGLLNAGTQIKVYFDEDDQTFDKEAG